MSSRQQPLRSAKTYQENIYKEVKPPSLKKVTFFDFFVFALIFFCIFFASLSLRSILFNIIILIVLLIKVFVGICFAKRQTWKSLRLYFIIRFAINTFLFFPLFFIFRIYTDTYPLNFLLAAILLFLSEITLVFIYIRELICKNDIEKLEEIRGSKIT